MKKIFYFIVTLSFVSIASFGQNTKADTLKVQLKLKELSRTEEAIKVQIAREDKKRDAVIKDVTPERQEEINDKQDSICLALRSQLVDTQIRMEELKKSLASSSSNTTSVSSAATLRGAIQTINPNKNNK